MSERRRIKVVVYNSKALGGPSCPKACLRVDGWMDGWKHKERMHTTTKLKQTSQINST